MVFINLKSIEMKKKVQVHILSTKDKTDVLIVSLKNLRELRYIPSLHKINLVSEDFKYREYQHLYLTSDEKIEEGDWALYLECGTNDEPLKNAYPYLVEFPDESHWNDRKIVATTDKALVYNQIDIKEVQGVKMEASYHKELPQIPQSFIKQYVEVNGKIDEVEIEIELKLIPVNKKMIIAGYITYHDLKLDSNNCVIIHLIEEKLYTIQDLENAWFRKGADKYTLFKEWINENF